MFSDSRPRLPCTTKRDRLIDPKILVDIEADDAESDKSQMAD